MASNFMIQTHQNSDNIHLRLMGDFDGSSACELIDRLKTCSEKTRKVFVHTAGLQDMDLFGRLVFQDDFAEISDRADDFIFTGKKLGP